MARGAAGRGVRKTEREVGERVRVEWIGGVQQVEFHVLMVMTEINKG